MEVRQHVFTDGVDLRMSTERGNQSALLSLKNARLFKRGETGFITTLEGFEEKVTIGATILAMNSWRDYIVVLYETAQGEFTIDFYDSSDFSKDWTFNYTDTSVTDAKLTVTENFLVVSNHNIYLYYDGTNWKQSSFKSTTPTFTVANSVGGTKAVGYIYVTKGADASRVTVTRVDAVYTLEVNVFQRGELFDVLSVEVSIDGNTQTFNYSDTYTTSAQLTNDIYLWASNESAITDVFDIAYLGFRSLTFTAKGAYQGTAGNNILFTSDSGFVEIEQTTTGVDAVVGETPGTKDNTEVNITSSIPINVTVNATITSELSAEGVRDAIYTALNANATITGNYTLTKLSTLYPTIKIEAIATGTASNGTITIDNNTNGVGTLDVDLAGGTAAASSERGTLINGKAYWYTARYVYLDGHVTKTAYPKLVITGSDQAGYLTIDAVKDIDDTQYARIEIFRKYEGGNFFKVHSVIPTGPILKWTDLGALELAALDEQNYNWTETHDTQEIVRDRLVKANITFPDVTVSNSILSAINVSKNETSISSGNTILPKNTDITIYARVRFNDGTDTLFGQVGSVITTDDDDANLTVSFSAMPENVKEVALYASYKKNFGTGNTHKFSTIEVANKNIPFIYSSSTYDTAHPYSDLDEIKPLNPHIFLGWKYITVKRNTTPSPDQSEFRVYDGEWDTKLTDFSLNDATKSYWVIQNADTNFSAQDFLYLDYTTPAYSYDDTPSIISDFTFSATPPTDPFFKKYKKKYELTSGSDIWYVYELACVDAIKSAAKESKLSIRLNAYTADRLSEQEQLNRYTNEWINVLSVLDTSETDGVPRSTFTSGARSDVFGPLKNHIYLVLPTQTIYDDIIDRDINQNKPNGLNSTSQGVVADYTSGGAHHTPILIQETKLTFEVGFLKEGTPTTPSSSTPDVYTLHDVGYNVTATSDMPFAQFGGVIYLGSFSPVAGTKSITSLGFTKRTSGSLIYSELNRYNIYELLITEDVLRNVKTDFPNQLIWSDPIVIETNISRARNFTFSNFKNISAEYGEIVDIRSKDNVLFVFCERGVAAVTVGEILTSQSGQQVIVDSSRFLNGEFWIFKNLKKITRLAIAEGDNTLFFSDGFDVWMHSDNWKNITNGKITIDTITGSYYDPYFREYRLFTNTGSWFYSVEGDAWSGKHTLTSSGGKAIGIDVYDFSADKIRKQNSGTLFATNSIPVEVKFRLNTLDAPDEMKTWRKLILETEGFSTVKYSDNTTTDKVTKSLAATQFQNGQFNVGISDSCSNARGLVVTLVATGVAKLKNLVYYFTPRMRR